MTRVGGVRSIVLARAAWVATVLGALVLVAVALPTEAGLVAFCALDGVIYSSVGLAIATRRPDNRIAAVLLLAGPLIVTAFLGYLGATLLAYGRGPDDPVAGLAGLVGPIVLYPTIALAVPVLAITFPDGIAPTRPHALLLRAALVVLAANAVVTVITPGAPDLELARNPLGIDHPVVHALSELAGIAAPLTMLALFLGAFSAVGVRFRRGDATVRAQLKWFLSANLVTVVAIVAAVLDGPAGITLIDFAAIAGLSLPALAVGLAVLRYRLYEIDRIISRTLAYALLTASLAAVFVGLVVGLQALLVGLTGEDTLPVAVSTLVVFALFQPLRRRFQRAVDRRFDRAKVDAERTTSAFGGRLRDQLDLPTLTGDLRRTVVGALQPDGVGVWIRGTAGER